MKMNNLEIILFALLLSGLNCSPVTRDDSMEIESNSRKQIYRRSIDDHGCRKMVIIHCELQKITYSSNNRLDFYEKCLFDGFTQHCG